MRSTARSPSPFVAIASPHPSPGVQNYQKGDTVTYAEVFSQVSVPLFFAPAANDPPSIYPDGADWALVKAPGSRNVPFPKQQHGFGPRADIRNPDNLKDVNLMISMFTEFFLEHVAGKKKL